MLISMLLGAFIQNAHAADDKFIIASVDYPPMIVVDGPKVSGVYTEVARIMTKNIGLSTQEITIASERVDRLNNEITGISFLFRNAAREKLGFKWIGSFVNDHLCFLTIKPHTPIATAEDAKKAKAVGVNGGSSTEKKLREMGLTNIEVATNSSGNIRKLVNKKIDSWFVGFLVGKYFSKVEGAKEGEAECSGEFGKVDYSIAATSKVDDKVVAALKVEFDKLKADGTIEKLISKYTASTK